jgi:hypothetical protein
MIRYTLVCEQRHEFESWFQSSAAYDQQVRRKLVACPACGSTRVEKAIMAPNLSHGHRGDDEDRPAAPPPAPPDGERAPVAILSPRERELRRRLKELRDFVTRNADDVGARFPEEARRMHYGEIERRSIYGEASLDEAKALAEEGIPFHPLPVLPDERN